MYARYSPSLAALFRLLKFFVVTQRNCYHKRKAKIKNRLSCVYRYWCNYTFQHNILFAVAALLTIMSLTNNIVARGEVNKVKGNLNTGILLLQTLNTTYFLIYIRL